MQPKKVLVMGAGGFIGNHLVDRLKSEGCHVVGVDLVRPKYNTSAADEFIVGDLRDSKLVDDILNESFGEIYQLAADMGGAGYIFTGDHDADIMHNSAKINLNLLQSALNNNKSARIFYSSSACVYPEHNQLDPDNPICSEDSVYPANPDSEYGWEKLFSERLYLTYKRNYNLNVSVARYHNIFGPKGSWNNGKEKAPAAICRKVAVASSGDAIDIWGDGKQTRSFLYIDECVTGTIKLNRSNLSGPFNIGSDKMISVDGLVDLVSSVANKTIVKKHIDGPTGVRGRNSDNTLIFEKLAWKPNCNLRDGIEKTYSWIDSQIKNKKTDE